MVIQQVSTKDSNICVRKSPATWLQPPCLPPLPRSPCANQNAKFHYPFLVMMFSWSSVGDIDITVVAVVSGGSSRLSSASAVGSTDFVMKKTILSWLVHCWLGFLFFSSLFPWIVGNFYLFDFFRFCWNKLLVLDPILAHRYLFLWFRGHFSFAIFLLFLLICLYTDHRLLRITHSARNGEQRPYIMPCTQTTQTNHCSRVGFRGQHATSSRRSQMDWNGLLNVLETFTAIYFPSNFQS